MLKILQVRLRHEPRTSKCSSWILKNGYQSVASDNQYIKNYTKGSDNLIVGHIMNHTLTLDELQDGFSEKTINNTVGFYKENSTGCYFNYNNGYFKS